MAIRARTQSRPWRRRNAKPRTPSFQARVAPQGPGLFCCPRRVLGTTRSALRPECPAGGIGIRTRLRNARLRVRIPGGVPGICSRSFAGPAPAQRPEPRGLLFDNSDVARLRPRGQAAARDEVWMTHVQTWLNGQSATLPASRRGFETCCLHQISFPSSNGEDRGPSSRVCRFKSGRERQSFGRWRSWEQTVLKTVANLSRVEGSTPSLSATGT